MLENQRVSYAFPTPAGDAHSRGLAEEVRAIAADVRRIGRGRSTSPEAILIDKHEAADRLLALASRMDATR